MDDAERDQVLARLDNRTKRVDEHIDRFEDKLKEHEEQLDDHESRIQTTESDVRNAKVLLGALGTGLLAMLSNISAKVLSILPILR